MIDPNTAPSFEASNLEVSVDEDGEIRIYHTRYDDHIFVPVKDRRAFLKYMAELYELDKKITVKVGNWYRLNNGQIHQCEKGENTPFVMGSFWYNEDGRCGVHTANAPHSVAEDLGPDYVLPRADGWYNIYSDGRHSSSHKTLRSAILYSGNDVLRHERWEDNKLVETAVIK